MSAAQAMGWRGQAEIDKTVIDALVTAVGAAVFAAMKPQFVGDLRSLTTAYHTARASGDAKASREAMHGLRGVALNVGLTKLGHLAAALERGEHDDEAELPGVLDAAIARLMSAGSN